MKKYLVLLVIFAMVIVGGAWSCTAPTTDGTTGPSGTWNMVFEDNFDGPSLNTTYWNYGWKSSANPTPPVNSDELACYAQDHVSFGYGSLVLNVTQPATPPVCGGVTRTYLSGAIESSGKQNFTPGSSGGILVEYRAQLDCASNGKIANWPAMWQDGDTGTVYNGMTTPGWPQHGENDTVEGLNGVGESTWHYGTGGGSQQNFGNFPSSVCGSFHVFSTEWTANKVVSYLDGVKNGEYDSATNVYEWPEFLIIGEQMSSFEGHYGGPVKSPSNLVVDYVRVYSR